MADALRHLEGVSGGRRDDRGRAELHERAVQCRVLREERAVRDNAPLMLLAESLDGALELLSALDVRVDSGALRYEPGNSRPSVRWQTPGVEPAGDPLVQRRLAPNAVSTAAWRVLQLQLRLGFPWTPEGPSDVPLATRRAPDEIGEKIRVAALAGLGDSEAVRGEDLARTRMSLGREPAVLQVDVRAQDLVNAEARESASTDSHTLEAELMSEGRKRVAATRVPLPRAQAHGQPGGWLESHLLGVEVTQVVREDAADRPASELAAVADRIAQSLRKKR